LHHAYLHGLKENGLLTPTGRVRATEFIDRVEKVYRPIAHLPPFDRIVSRSTVHGLLKLVRKPRSPANPICHLLLINLLFGKWELFASILSWEKLFDVPHPPQPANPKSIPSPQRPPSHLEDKLSRISQQLSEERISLAKACRKEDLDIGTAMRWLGKLGCQHVQRRPKTVTSELRSQTERMLNQGLPLVLISKQLGLSRATVDRICNESPELNQQWKAANFEWKRVKYRRAFLDSAASSDAKFSRKNIRNLKGAGYNWLYQHDRAWLSEHLPKSKTSAPRVPVQRRARIDWDFRDRECSMAIAALGLDVQLESWERKKPRAILRRLPKLSFSPRLDRLPKSREAVTAILNEIRRKEPMSQPSSQSGIQIEKPQYTNNFSR